MDTIITVLHLDLARALRDHWRASEPELHLAVGGTGLAAWLASVDWAAVLAFTALAVTTIAGTGMQLYKQWKLIRLEVEERKREIQERAAAIRAVREADTGV